MPVVYGVAELEDQTLDKIAEMDFDVSCNICKHYGGGSTCAAFPKGIPSDVLSGVKQHAEPISGDSGIRFEEVEDEDERA